MERVKNRLARHKPAVVQGLTKAGLTPLQQDYAGVFVWAALPGHTHRDAGARCRRARHRAHPESLFFLDCEHSPWLRFNAASANDARLFDYLGSSIAALSRATLRSVTLPAPSSSRST